MRSLLRLAFVIPALAAACSPDDDVNTDGGIDYARDTFTCSAGTPYCSADGSQVLRCDSSTGAVTVVETCTAGRTCVFGACIVSVCTPGASECVDSHTQRRCRPDGSAWDESACGEALTCNSTSGACEVPCDLRLFVVLDKSGSMSGPEGGPSKWSQARTALHALTSAPAAAEAQFGFGVFPTDGDCAVDGYVLYPLPTATGAIIDGYLGSNSPNGNTPLAAVLDAIRWDDAANLRDDGYHNAIVLVSDGVDTCHTDCLAACGLNFACIMACERDAEVAVAEALAETTRALRDEHQIRTFVIGFGADVSEAQLTNIAENGGTALGRWIQASNVDELTAALQTVLDEMGDCLPIIY